MISPMFRDSQHHPKIYHIIPQDNRVCESLHRTCLPCLLGSINHQPRYNLESKVHRVLCVRICHWRVKLSLKAIPNTSHLILDLDSSHHHHKCLDILRCKLIPSCHLCIHHTSTHLTWTQSSTVCSQEECLQEHPRWTQWWWEHLIQWDTSILNKQEAIMLKCSSFKHS